MNYHLAHLLEAIDSGLYVFLDTETTGLDRTAELCSIAVIAADGTPLLDTLIKPVRPMPAAATAIHGYTDDSLADAPSWQIIKPSLMEAIAGQNVIVYNAQYDRRILHQSDEANGLPQTDYKTDSKWVCAMEAVAPLFGAWNDYRQKYTWVKLTDAARAAQVQPRAVHSALGDALTTRLLCLKLFTLYSKETS